MGEVYAAEDTELRRSVAIKLPMLDGESGENRRRFLHEARAASQLTHPNIARIYDFGTASDGRPFLVMELIEGTSLKELLHEGPLSEGKAAGIIAGVLRALSEAHAHGLVHRDIKPANVMIAKSGDLKVLDFGLAKGVPSAQPPAQPDAGTTITNLTTRNVLIGTPVYMSPEQIRGGFVDARSDLFSAGVLLYECLTGTTPFSGFSTREVFDRILDADPVPPCSRSPGLSKGWDALIAKALRKEPEQRYKSAEEMLSAVEAVAPTRSAWQSVAGILTGSSRRTAIASLLAATLIVGILFFVRGTGSHQPVPEAVDWYNRGAVALRDGTYYGAARMLQKAVDLDPDFSLAHARLAEAATELDDGARAASEMLAALPKGSGSIPGGVTGFYIDAIHRTLTRDFKEAAKDYVELSNKMEGPEKSAVLVDLGRVYEKDNDTARALAVYQEALALDPQNAAAHLKIGVLLGRRKDNAYEGELDHAFQLYQTLSNIEGQAEVLYQRGLLLSSVNLMAARGILERSREMAHAIPSEQQEVAATLQLSTVAYLSGELETAERMAMDGVERARRAGMNYLAARGLADLGGTQFLKRDYTRAENSYTESLDLSRRFAMHRTEARALAGLANLHQTVGLDEKALLEAAPAWAYYHDSGFQIEAVQSAMLLARSHRNLGHGNESAASFEQALAAARQMSDPMRVLQAEQGLATVFQFYGRLPEAVKQHERARQSAAALNDTDDVVRALAGLGAVLWRLGRYQEANDALAEGERVVEKSPGRVSLEPLILYRKAEIALSSGKNADAIAIARRVLDTKGTNMQAGQSIRCISALALARQGQVAEGRRMCEPAVEALLPMGERFAAAEARLYLAEILLAAGDATGAVDASTKVVEWSATVKDPESEWRAWALRARGLRRRDEDGARQAAQKARELFTQLPWDQENLKSYSNRPDIQTLERTIQDASR
jgi:tetratricopeptide (TPR) repeat protein